MSTDTLVREPQNETVIPQTPQVLPMDEAIQQIRRDSRQDPQQFLDESVVPHGGE